MPTYFLTGANRGLGIEFVRQISADSKNTVIAAVRSKSGKNEQLDALASRASNIHIIECDIGSLDSISAVESTVQDILSKSGTKLDYLLNNAGINATSSDTAITLDPKSLHHHIDVNVLGPAKVIETLQKYLADGAVVMNMTSGLASMHVTKSITKCCSYSISKAALNMLTLHEVKALEPQKAIVIVMDPGWVKTDMGGEGAQLEPEDSIGGMLKTIHGLKPADTGKFYTYTGEEVPW